LIGRNLLVPVRLQTMRLWWLGGRDSNPDNVVQSCGPTLISYGRALLLLH
jgi:hypothetical protein